MFNLSYVVILLIFLYKYFLQVGADVNGKGSIMPPLLVAVEKGGCTNFIQLLLKAGADPNIPNMVSFIL